MPKVINDGNTLKSFIRSVLDEKLREAITGPSPLMVEDDLEQALGGSDKKKDAAQAAPAPSDDDNQDQQPGGENVPEEIDVKAVVEKLNSIRSGRSFRDSAVEQRMDAFFNNLDDSERKALYQFLSGLAQVVTGEVPTETVIKSGDPSNPPANVKIEPSDDKKSAKISLKPNISVSKPKEREQTQSTEDTSAPAPINPKKR